jgi:hypothetical protein
MFKMLNPSSPLPDYCLCTTAHYPHLSWNHQAECFNAGAMSTAQSLKGKASLAKLP